MCNVQSDGGSSLFSWLVTIISLLAGIGINITNFKDTQNGVQVHGGDSFESGQVSLAEETVREISELLPDGMYSIRVFASILDYNSWQNDYKKCSDLIDNSRLLRNVGTYHDVLEEGKKYVNNGHPLRGIYFFYIASELVIEEPSYWFSYASASQNKRLDTLLLARTALRILQHQINTRDQVRLSCTLALWRSLVWKIFLSEVNLQNGEVILQAWWRVSLALTYAELQYWLEAKKTCNEALVMIEQSFGKNSPYYHVYGWAIHIKGVAHEKLGETIKGASLRADASAALRLAADNPINVDFEKTMFRLFPYRLHSQHAGYLT